MGTFWDRPEQVAGFAARSPDKRLIVLVKSYVYPKQTRVLDLGCAAGRNTAMLAELGFDVYAVDRSPAMIEKTRERVSAFLGMNEAARRVAVGKMENLNNFDTGSFDLLVALGVYQNAVNEEQWNMALDESARVMAGRGQLLVANFSPRSNPTGGGLKLVSGERHVYEGFSSGRVFLLETEELDAQMALRDLHPVVPTTAVEVATDTGCRVTVNAFYRKG